MLHHLRATERVRAEQLFAGMDFHLIIRAVIASSSPGAIYVDSPQQPSAAFVSSAEGCYLAGNCENTAFIADLRDMLAATVFAQQDGGFSLCVDPACWESQLVTLIPDRALLKAQRRHYTCRNVTLDWRALLPGGYAIRQIDAQLLADPSLRIPEHIPSWMRANWGSSAAFLANGCGMCTIHGGQVVAWSLADCIVGDRCEIGIHTAPEYRKRGLAALTAAALAEHCLKRGIAAVGWHCGEENVGSWKTAEKVGFVQTAAYTSHYCRIDQAIQST